MKRSRYPREWDKISERIRFVRAAFVCECTGQCGHKHFWEVDGAKDRRASQIARCPAAHGMKHPVTGSKVVLTVAHLDHNPGNCAEDNLLAMCQRCHLAYDERQHVNNRRKHARHALERAGQQKLFE